MILPTSVPDIAFGDVGLTTDGLWHSSFRSMASPIRLQLGPDSPEPQRRQAEVRALFGEVERQCTRFDPASDLMRANAAGSSPTEVGVHCFAALQAAVLAHHATSGRFDPRVLTVLRDLGYGSSLAFSAGPVRTEIVDREPEPVDGTWRPRFDAATRQVAVGAVPVDLGGIGKGLALRWAAELLRSAGCTTFLLDAGGDCVFGHGPEGEPWRIGVEDPAGGDGPVAVLEAADGACTTSSVRLRQWQAGDQRVHHLIDPRTGRPGGGHLRSVTVIGTDPADAEVWSKVLFLAGDRIGAEAAERKLAALWVDDAGRSEHSPALAPYLIWERV
jgi:FAD:protein FMN transferase